MRGFYVIGGQERKNSVYSNTPHWHQHEKGLILRVDCETKAVKRCMEYVTPAEACAAENDPSIVFKAGTVQGTRLYVCTETEVLIYELPYFERVGYVSLPSFNDLHHVCPTRDGNLLVAVTGLDKVIEVTQQGEVLREWNVLGEDPWERFSKDVDYRKVPTTKPHKSHPNYVFHLGEDIWVTRFEQRDAVCLTNPTQQIQIAIQRPHDGVLHEGLIYFTTVNGCLVIVNQNSLKIQEVVDLNKIHNTDKPLGWCRGVMIDEGRVWVGFSRIRTTRFKANINWVKNGFRKDGIYGSLPTHIACYDILKKECVQEIFLMEHGLSSVFAIVPEQ